MPITEVTLSTDQQPFPVAACITPEPPRTPGPTQPYEGVEVDARLTSGFPFSLSFSNHCLDLHGLTACPATKKVPAGAWRVRTEVQAGNLYSNGAVGGLSDFIRCSLSARRPVPRLYRKARRSHHGRRGAAAVVLADELPPYRPFGARLPTLVMRFAAWMGLTSKRTPRLRARLFDQDRTESLSPPSWAGTGTRVYMGGGGLAFPSWAGTCERSYRDRGGRACRGASRRLDHQRTAPARPRLPEPDRPLCCGNRAVITGTGRPPGLDAVFRREQEP
jgi:hypothetical protein